MNFLEAVRKMKEGKKAQRKGCIVHLEQNDFKNYGGKYVSGIYEMDLFDIEATDWEIVEEKKTLSDKIKVVNFARANEPVREAIDYTDVKEAIKEFLKKPTFTEIERAKRIFGERLI